jgi:hypothetical protein
MKPINFTIQMKIKIEKKFNRTLDRVLGRWHIINTRCRKGQTQSNLRAQSQWVPEIFRGCQATETFLCLGGLAFLSLAVNKVRRNDEFSAF